MGIHMVSSHGRNRLSKIERRKKIEIIMNVLYCIVLHCTVSFFYCIVLYCIVLYLTMQHSNLYCSLLTL